MGAPANRSVRRRKVLFIVPYAARFVKDQGRFSTPLRPYWASMAEKSNS